MDTDVQQWERMIRGLRSGDQRVIGEFCARYGTLMHQLAEKHLARGVRRRVGPEDVAQSACRTFLRRAQGGEFRFTDSEDLWRLLCAITLTKVREQTRFHMRQKRGLQREQPLEPVSADGSAMSVGPADLGQTPAEIAEFSDQFRQIIEQLDEEERRIVYLKLDDCTNDEVAQTLGCSERTIRRILKQMQARLAQVLEA